MLKSNEPLSMNEVLEYVEKEKGSEAEIVKFIKKFSKLTNKDTRKLKENLASLDLMKIRPEHIAKIIDIMPENQEDLNKIFTEISLDEDESKKILDTIKQFK